MTVYWLHWRWSDIRTVLQHCYWGSCCSFDTGVKSECSPPAAGCKCELVVILNVGLQKGGNSWCLETGYYFWLVRSCADCPIGHKVESGMSFFIHRMPVMLYFSSKRLLSSQWTVWHMKTTQHMNVWRW